MLQHLFQLGHFTLHSGEISSFKIECDALHGQDWDTLSYIIHEKVHFRKVIGVPMGGLRLEGYLRRYEEPNRLDLPILIVDDVLTTGKSMEKIRKELGYRDSEVIGYVAFARNECPDWIQAIFQMS